MNAASKTIIFFDHSDSANPGWAWRYCECSGPIDSSSFLESLIRGDIPNDGDANELLIELAAMGIDYRTVVLCDGEHEIGHIWP